MESRWPVAKPPRGMAPMILDRLVSLIHCLTDKTVFAELLYPVERVLARVRSAQGLGRTLSMSDFIALGVLRHLQGMGSLREQVQALLHLDPVVAARPPLARSTWSDALGSPIRLAVLQELLPMLVGEAAAVLPDRLAGIPGLGTRPVRAIDGTYQGESAHFRRCTPKEGGASTLTESDPFLLRERDLRDAQWLSWFGGIWRARRPDAVRFTGNRDRIGAARRGVSV